MNACKPSVRGLQQKPTVTSKLIWSKETKQQTRGPEHQRDPQRSPSVSGRGLRGYCPPYSPSFQNAKRLSFRHHNFPGATSLSDPLKVYQKFSQRILLSAFPPPGHFPPPRITLHLHPTMLPLGPRELQASRVRFHPCLLPVAGKSGSWKANFPSDRSQRAKGARHSQLVDGVLRDDRVGGEVGDHVGATEAAGAGEGRLLLAGQRAQGHGAGSGRTAPHRGPRPARHEALALGSTGLEAQAVRAPGGRLGPAGSRGGSRRSPGARPWSPSGRAPPAARPNSRPGRGGAGLSAPAGRSREPEGRARRSPAPELVAHHGSAAGVRACGARVGTRPPRLEWRNEASPRLRGGQERLAFLWNVSTERTLNRLYIRMANKLYFSNDLKT